jgi:hypothetical protein
MSDYDEPMQYVGLVCVVIHPEPVDVVTDCGDTDHTVSTRDGKQVHVNAFHTAYHTSVQEAEGFVAYEQPACHQDTQPKPVDLDKVCDFVIVHADLEQRAQEVKRLFGLEDKPHIMGQADWMQYVLSFAPPGVGVDEWDIYTDWVHRSGVLDKLVDLT